MGKERVVGRTCGVAFLILFLAQGIATATELTKDDVDFRKDVYVGKTKERLPYRLFVPTGYDSTRNYPLVLWLHGNDGRGSDNIKQITRENQLGTHFWIGSAVQTKFSAFVLAPQCPSGQNWSEPEFNQPSKYLLLTMEVLAKVQKDFSIDPDRVFIAGQAMGGIGAWSLLQNYPGKWAGAMVLSAYDTFSDVPSIVRVSLWVFQGDEDPSVPVTMVRSMIAQLKKAGANLRYTEYHKMGHEVWNDAFAEPDLVPWISTQKRVVATRGQLGSGVARSSH